MTESVTTTHLAMDSPDRLKPRVLDDTSLAVSRISPPNGQLNHAFFMEIGVPFRWYSRLSWDLDAWNRYANDPAIQTWIGTRGGTPYGYFELETYDARKPEYAPTLPFSDGIITQIMFFGIFESARGKGLGAHLLTEAVRMAWATPGTTRVYLHTCTSDHDAALANYVARGFTNVGSVTVEETIPRPDDPIWCSPAYYRALRGDE